MAGVTVAIYSDFLSSFTKLPIGIQNKTNNFIKKFKANPKDPGLNFEKIKNPYDDKFYSCRVDLTYRVILAMQETTNTYILLWVDHHDEAYKWANSKKIEVNKLNGSLQLYDIIPTKREVKPVVNNLFDKYTDEQLLALGLPELQLEYLRSLETESDFFSNKKAFSTDVFECLSFLVDGVEYNEVLDLVQDLNDDEINDDFDKALKHDNNGRSFRVVEGQDELDEMFKAPLDKWRIFLHPTQKRIVEKEYSGPARVSGEAGTGKTVVAMHRAKYLLSKGKKVLFTTFTANLVEDIKNNIMKILSFQEIKNLDIKSVDSVINSYLCANGKKYNIIYDDEKLESYWAQAINNANIEDFDIYFYMDEWSKIATVMDVLSVDKYISVPRIGRGIRLDRQARLKVWHVFEEYMELLNKENARDMDYATYEARMILKTKLEHPYDSIIIDESQDISANAFKFLRLYAGDIHENDMFIVGDSHQRIYKNKAVLSKCGINIRGRSCLLRINYRTTEETRKYAYGFLTGLDFSDLDTELFAVNRCQSLTHGDQPEVKNFNTFEEQIEYCINEIQMLHDKLDVKYEDICVVSRTHKQIELSKNAFLEVGMQSYEINSNKSDNSFEKGIRLATMHRVKGLEFRYVFIISVNKDIFPMKSNALDKELNEERRVIERCLLYVALTRAQIKAYVLSYGTPSSLLCKI